MNADFTIDNKPLKRGINEVTEAEYNIMKDLDVSGLPMITKEQDKLCVKVEETKPVKSS